MSIEDIDFEGQKKEIDSPRSLKACEDLGILPEELFHKKFDDFVKEHPDIINLPIEALKIRYNNIEEYRNKIIAEVKKKRNDIINERLEETGKSHKYTKNDLPQNDISATTLFQSVIKLLNDLSSLLSFNSNNSFFSSIKCIF